MLEVFAPAKLTLSLRISGRRDDGYHLIDAEMITLDFGDRLEIDPTAEGLEIVGPAGARIDTGANNLVSRALRLAEVSAFVRVHKEIPPGAGLGGGSADAAAVLRWAGYRDEVGAATIGADVAFCLNGGRSRVRGIGEIIEPLEPESRAFTLATPLFGCSTPAVYHEWDRLGGPKGANGNDLEVAALNVEPRLVEVRDRLGDATGKTPRLAGSGSTWFVEGEYPGRGRRVAHSHCEEQAE